MGARGCAPPPLPAASPRGALTRAWAVQRGWALPEVPDEALRGVGARLCTAFPPAAGGGAARAPHMLYMPLARNAAVDAEVDPAADDWSHFMRFAYKAEHFDRLLRVARANARACEQEVRAALRAALQRRRAELAVARAGAE